MKKMTLFNNTAIALSLFIVTNTSNAQLATIDVANLSENSITSAQALLVAARTLQSNINEATMITNQITSLANELKNLTNLPYDIIGQYTSRFQQLMGNIQSISGLVKNYNNIISQYNNRYPNLNGSWSSPSMNTLWRDSWHQQNISNLQQTLQQGALIISHMQQMPSDTQSMASASQGAPGALQAIQAGNQISLRVAEELGRMNAQTVMYQNAILEQMAAQEADHYLALDQRNQLNNDRYSTYSPNPAADPRY